MNDTPPPPFTVHRIREPRLDPAPGTEAIREGLVALKTTLARVQHDVEADAAAIDGRPFTAANVAELLGTHLAMTAVLAHLVEQLSDFVGLLSNSTDLVYTKAVQAWEAT